MGVIGKSEMILVGICFLVAMVAAGGSKDYGDECSIGGQILNIITSDKDDNPNACNTDKKLVCLTGKCMCNPGLVYEKGLFGLNVYGHGCKSPANMPCGRESNCVSNSRCDVDSSISLCRCNDGYHTTTEGLCSNGANAMISFTPFHLLALLASSYFMFSN